MTALHRPSFFSLRWLIILAVVLFPLLSRAAYFRQRAIFHESEAARLQSLIPAGGTESSSDSAALVQAYEHRYLAGRYRRAMYRPMTVIFEPAAPWERRKETGGWCISSRR